MLISSDFLSYMIRKKENEKRSSPLVTASLKSSPGGKEKSPPVEQRTDREKEEKMDDSVDYLNEKSSTLNVIL
jgi:hypothetical protein